MMPADGPVVPAVSGYSEGEKILFLHTEASDAKIARILTEMMGSPVLLVPSLAQAPETMLAKLYVFTNGVVPDGPKGPLLFQPSSSICQRFAMPPRKKSIAIGSNDSLAGLETRVVRKTLHDLIGLEKNARYMDNAQFSQLVEILKRDGALTSQLSHNAISGADDPNVLGSLYVGLDLAMKQYTGLTDDDFKVDELDLNALGIGSPAYEELSIIFLPEQAEVFMDLLKKVESSKKRPIRLVAHVKDFGKIFDAIVAVKKGLNIHNSATALVSMA